MVTRRRRQVDVVDRRVGLRGSAPALVILAGLAAVMGVVATTPGLSPSYLLAVTRSGFGLFPVRFQVPVGYDPGFDLAKLDPFVDDRLRVLTVALTITYFISVTALGNVIIRGIRGSDRWPRLAYALAGFLPGYLMLLMPLQLLFAVLPLVTAAWFALVGVPVAAVAVHRQAIMREAATVMRDRSALARWGVVAGGAVVAVALAMTHRLQAGMFYLTQDSIQWFLITAGSQLQGEEGKYLAQWGQQSDQWVFNAPLMFSSGAGRDFWFPLYAAQCIALASFSSLVYGIVHGVARRRKALAATVATATVFGSTLAIYPWVYITVIGGDNPILTTGQTGRLIGVIAPWVALLAVGRQSRGVAVALGLATLGLGFTSIEVLPWVLVAVTAALVWPRLGGWGGARINARWLRRALDLVPVAALGAIASTFWWLHQDLPGFDPIWWLVAGIAVALAGAVVICAATVSGAGLRTLRPSLGWGCVWLLALGLGMLLANNGTLSLFDGWFHRQLGYVFPGYGGDVVMRPDIGPETFRNLSPHLSVGSCLFFDYCHAFPNFLAAFGFFFTIVLATWFAFGPITSDVAINVRRVAWLLLVAGVGTALVLVLFNGSEGPVVGVLFSRFLDAPYYGLLALAALTFAESRGRATVIVGTGVLIVWTVVPLIATQWPEQMLRNGGWFLQRAGVL